MNLSCVSNMQRDRAWPDCEPHHGLGIRSTKPQAIEMMAEAARPRLADLN